MSEEYVELRVSRRTVLENFKNESASDLLFLRQKARLFLVSWGESQQNVKSATVCVPVLIISVARLCD